MRKLFAASVKMTYRNRQGLFWSLAFPIIFVVVFGLFNFEETPTAKVRVVVEQASAVSAGLVAGLRSVEPFDVSESASLSEAKDDLESGDVDLVVFAPAGLGTGVPLQAFYGRTNPLVKDVALSILRQVVDGLNLRLAGVSSPPVPLRLEAVSAKRIRYYDFLLPGLVGMGALTASVIGMAVTVATYREQRIFKRILATPLAPVRFLIAQVLARLLLAAAQTALILVVGVYGFGANLYGNVVWLFLLATLGNLIFLVLGIAVAGRAANANTAASVANAATFPMMFLSGTFFSTDTLPGWLREVVPYLPLTPLIDAMRKVAVDGLSITATGGELAILAGWVAVLFAVAARTFRFEA